ncbi:MAG: hypothetical protein Q4A61_05060 [Porphyromonadaceae bacterium]|nr:hypothetical protein [Porphyromonadaceae bacterium]
MPIRPKRLTRVWSSALLLCTLVLSGCDESHAPLPNLAPVSASISLHIHRELLTPGGMVRLTQPIRLTDALGYGGLLVVRSLTEEAFYAYDLACPNELSGVKQVEIVDERAVCPACHSVFDVLLSYGAPVAGPAKRPLRPYQTYYSAGTRELRIMN